MFYKNTRVLSKEVNELHEKELINSDSKNAIQAYYEKFVNIAINNTLATIVGFIGLHFVWFALGELLSGATLMGRNEYLDIFFMFIPLAVAAFLFYMGYSHEESRNNSIIKEFTSTYLFLAFVGFVGYVIFRLELFPGTLDLDQLRWFVFFVLSLIGIGLTIFRNSTGVMLLTIPLILAFTFGDSSAISAIRNPMGLLSGGAAGSYYLVSLILFCALFLHFWLNVDTLSKKQDFKAVALGWIASTLGYYFFMLIIPGNYFLFTTIYILGLYIFGKLYFDDNANWFGRPLQTFALILTVGLLFSTSFTTGLTSGLVLSTFYGVDGFGAQSYDFWIWLIVLLGLAGALYYFYVKPMYIDGEDQFNPLIIALPIFIFFIMILGLLKWETFPKILVNLYLIGLCVYLMVNGSQEKYHSMYVYGLGTLVVLMISRYMDIDVHWTLRVLFFLMVGAAFFGVAFTLKDRTDGHENP